MRTDGFLLVRGFIAKGKGAPRRGLVQQMGVFFVFFGGGSDFLDFQIEVFWTTTLEDFSGGNKKT